jgi:large subunit ribosomal protein L23
VKDPHTIIRQPLITEKATHAMDEGGVYVFTVDPSAIENIFDVKVKNVNTVNQVGKRKRLGRALGFTKTYKKAIVTLAPGHKIDVL